MGLFGKIFNGVFGKPERSQQEIAFEKSVIKDGHEYAGMRVAQIINDKITSKSLAKQFVLEELDAARQGNDYAVNFVRQSGFGADEYIGAMSKTKWAGNESELEHLQLYFRYFLMQIKDTELMVKLSTSTVEEIMKIWNIGKYNIDLDDEKFILKRLSEISGINSEKRYAIEVDPVNEIWTYSYKFSEDEHIEARDLIMKLHAVGSYLVRENNI